MLFDQREDLKNITYEEIGEIYETAQLSSAKKSPICFYRGKEAINWMLNYKWPTNADQAEPSDYHYYFSEIQDVFRYIALNLCSKDNLNFLGFVILSFASKNGRTTLKVLDFNVQHDKNRKYVLRLALKYADIYQAGCIEIPERLLTGIEHRYFMRFMTRKKKRIYLCRPKNRHSHLAKALAGIELNVCDGDPPFT